MAPVRGLNLSPPTAASPHSVERLAIGRNLVPISNLSDGLYTVRLSSEDYVSVEIPMIAEGRMLNPPKDAQFPNDTHADYNMIGVRFEPKVGRQK